MKARNLIKTAIISLALTGCVTLVDDESHKGSFSPEPAFLRNLPQTEDLYSLGFRDGCYNFMGQTGLGLLREYDKAPNPQFITDEEYNFGYKNGDRYCSVFVNNGISL